MGRPSWRTVSLRAWISVGIAVTVLPLLVFALSHAIVTRSVIADFQRVAGRERDQLIPLQQLQASLVVAGASMERWLRAGDSAQATEYHKVRDQIETRFARVSAALVSEVDASASVARARADWTAADRLAARMFGTPLQSRDALQLGAQARALITVAVDQLDSVQRSLATTIERDDSKARRSAQRAERFAGFAAVVSVFSIILGIAIAGHLVSRTFGPLVDGAVRVRAGERGHRIEVAAPPELHRVADAINQLASELHESHVALAALARHDYLTGLLNRRAFDEMLGNALARHERVDEGVAMVVIDVDLLTTINAAHGHAAGDEVLRLVSARVAESIREIDRAFRVGGEEFAVLLFNTDRESAEAAAERIRVAVATGPMRVNGVEIGVTISAGIATTDDSANAEGLLNAADAALYCAKSTGRNRVVWVGAMA